MKTLLSSCVLYAILALHAMGSLELPQGTYTHEQIEEARARAVKEHKPIAWLEANAEYAGEKPELVQYEATGYLKALGDSCVLIYLAAAKRDEIEPVLPPMINKAHERYFPSLVITSPKEDHILLAMSAHEFSSDTKAAARAIREASRLPQGEMAPAKAGKLDLPDTCFDHRQLEEARALAESSGKPVAFVHTEKTASHYPWVAETTNFFLRALGDDCILVYLDVQNLAHYRSSLPRGARGSIGRGFPCISILSVKEWKNNQLGERIDFLDYESSDPDELTEKIRAAIRRAKP